MGTIDDERLSFEEVKLAHRIAMEHAKYNFNSDANISEFEGKIDYISKFNQSSIQMLNLSQEKINSLNSAIEDHKFMLKRFEYTTLSKQKVVTTDPVEAQQFAINDLEHSNLYSSSEIDLIRRVSNSFLLAENGSIQPTSINDSSRFLGNYTLISELKLMIQNTLWV